MKYFILSVLTLVFFLSAETVTPDRAGKVAENYYAQYVPDAAKGNTIQKVLTKEYMGQPTWYVFQFTEGWVIVSADDAVRPILGYSFDGEITEDLDNMQNPFVNRFSYYDRQIVHNVREKGYVDGKSSAEWIGIENNIFPKGSRAIVVDALVETKWGQGWPWNEMCPEDSTGNPCPAGCVATAMHQILRYRLSPAQGTGSHSYNDVWGSTTGYHSVDFSSAVYDWDLIYNIIDITDVSTQDQVNELAKMSYHCGVAVDMDYESSGSGAYISDVPSALESYFSFSTDATYSALGTITNPTTWASTIRQNLDNYRPLIWGGAGTQGGHAFILDGYTDDYWYHFNWGWEGNFDGWFQLTALTPDSMDFTSSQSCAYNLWGYSPYPFPAPHIENIEVSDRENIIINWSVPSYHDDIQYFEISRNNESIVQLPDSVFTYTDYSLPAGTYNYEVDAVYQYFPSTAYCPSVVIADDTEFPAPRYFDTSLESYNRHHIDLSWVAPFTNTISWEDGFEENDFDTAWTCKRTVDYPPTGRKVSGVIDNFTKEDVSDGWFLCDESSFGDPQFIHSGNHSMAVAYTAQDYSWAITPKFSLEAGSELRFWHWISGNSSSGWLTTYYINVYGGIFTEANPSLFLHQVAAFENVDENNENKYNEEVIVDISSFSGQVSIAWAYKYTDGYQVAVDDIIISRSDFKETLPDSYRIYRNGVQADEVLYTGEQETYRDTLFSDGWNEYYVKAVYPAGISIPSEKSEEFMDANPKPWFLTAFLPGASTVELSWYEPYTTPSQWFDYVEGEPDSWWDHMPSGLGFDYSAYQNRTLFNKDDIYEFPVMIDSIAAAFYEDTSDPWVSDKFTFSIYSGGSTVMGPTAELTAVSGEYVKYALPVPLELSAPWYIVVDPKDNIKGHPGILSSYKDQTHSETYLDLNNNGTPDGWYNITADTLYHEWWISCHVASGLPSKQKKIGWISNSPVISVNGRTTPEIELKDLKIIPAGFLGYKIYRDNTEIATTDSTSYTDILAKEQTTADYHVTAFYENPAGESAPSNIVTVTITSIEDNIPYETSLSQNYPNPFNPETNIRFSIAADTKVSLKIYNTAGQLVAVPVDKFMNRGSYNINLNASKLSGGVYIYRLEADGKEFSKKMTVVK